MNSAVAVTVDAKTKTTAVKRNTDSPFYNEYFVFEFNRSIEKLMDKNITITVVEPGGYWRKRKILGLVTLDIATVWYQTNHQFFHKWAVLHSPKTDRITGPRGYIKIDIAILAKGESPKIPPNVVNDEIEGNLLLPQGLFSERQKAFYSFEVYKCIDLVEKPSQLVQDLSDSIKTIFSSYVEITFAGISVRTSVKRNTTNPEFNEKLTIVDFFPPLCQRIKIEVCYADLIKRVHCCKYINLKLISNEKEEGFLPTFGPTYLHLYGTGLEGYTGSILMSMDTQLDDLASNRKVTLVESILPMDEKKFITYETVTLLCCVFEVTAINKKLKDKFVSLKTTFGKISLQFSDSAEYEGEIGINMTLRQVPRKSTKNSYYLHYEHVKECIWIQLKIPYFKKRISNSNILAKIANELRSRLNYVQSMFDYYKTEPDIEQINKEVVQVLDFTLFASNKYLDILSGYGEEFNTKLDKERKIMCQREMTQIVDKTIKLYKETQVNVKIRKLEKFYRKIKALVEDVQDCGPDVFIWLVVDNKKISVSKIPAREVVYSPVTEEKGESCGIRKTICFHSKEGDSTLLAMANLMLILTLERHNKDLETILPKQYHFKKSIETFPRPFTATEKHTLRLRAQILYGDVVSGFDKTGLADPFVRITVQNIVKQTKSLPKCLNPVWNETLIFNNVIIYGSREEIHLNMPKILVELFDKDAFGDELIGRSVITPELLLSDSDVESIKLKWHKVYFNGEVKAEILGTFTFIESRDVKAELPQFIEPKLAMHRIEVMFWGMRNLDKVHLLQINRPRISIICQNDILYSDTIENARVNPNFHNQFKQIDMILPVESEYTPPLIIKMFDSRSFGIFVYAGVHITQTYRYKIYPHTLEERNKYLAVTEHVHAHQTYIAKSSSSSETNESKEDDVKVPKKKVSFWGYFKDEKSSKQASKLGTYELLSQEDNETLSEEYDWWSKFYASIEEPNAGSDVSLSGQKIKKLKVYPNELEQQPEFQGFNDILTCFDLYKGKKTGDELMDDQNITGIFKGLIKIYRWPLEDDQTYVNERGYPLEKGIFENFPDNQPQSYLLRVYCVRGLRLNPKDINGRSDPYLRLTLNNKIVVDKENLVVRAVNPVFGRCFEFNANFPFDHSLKIAVWDYDVSTGDDLIGETVVDLEKRFFTKYRANCGIPETYEESGYCEWRLPHKPTQILTELCKKWQLDEPEYNELSVRIGFKEFICYDFVPSDSRTFDKEVIALCALRRWNEMPLVGFSLVPEHVESRSLYNPSKPGIEQGKIQLWIDMLAVTDLPPSKKVNITPRKPVKYELRVIVWNTEDVILDEDEFFTGERKSDIYIKGWLVDSSTAQYTDVHYRSITGEGNFNWRFIFPFEYLPTENKLIIRKKESIFDVDETEFKIPCRLTLQVWDNDTFSKNDFLGTLTLELARLRRGARIAKKCNLSLMQKGAPTVNLFKIRRTKGWWPFRGVDKKSNKEICTGKIEVELEIVTDAEAQKNPAGLGRNPPQPLLAPNRPDTSFSWFRNPFMAMKFVCCKLYRGRIICCTLIIFVTIFLVIAFYTLPGSVVKKIVNDVL